MPAIIVPVAIRRDTAANWTAANPVLLSGQEGYETDTRKRKVGNGTSAWNALAYDSTAGLTAEDASATYATITAAQEAQARADAAAASAESASRGDVVYLYTGTGVAPHSYALKAGEFDNGISSRRYAGGPDGAPESLAGHVPRDGDWHQAVNP